MSFAVHVQPRAKREGVIGVYGDAIKIAINAPAIEGQANDALVRLLSVLLGTSRGSVEITSGHASRSKIVRVLGVSCSAVSEILLGQISL